MARPPITRSHPYTPARGQLAGRTFTSERQYRNALAGRKGQISLGAQQRSATAPIETVQAYKHLKPAEQQAYVRAREALGIWRRGDASSLTEAAHMAGTTPNAMRKYVSPALETEGLKTTPRDSDRLLRPMPVVTTSGVPRLLIENSDDARLISGHSNTVRHFLEARTPESLERANKKLDSFRGQYVLVDGQKHYLETDRTKLRQMAEQGELDYESIYEDAA